jgi:hypothetical protein
MSTRNFPVVKKRPVHRADNLAAIYEPNVWKLWEPQLLTTLRASTGLYSDSYTFYRSFVFICQSKRVWSKCVE